MKTVRIKNYQSIKDSTVDLSPGVNVLLGHSDTGKSAFIRAIRDVCFNATGTGMIRLGTKKAEVTVDDVTWIKAKSVNRYTVGEDVYDKVGRGVPDEVSASLGIRDVEFGKGISRRLQFAAQLDPHFIIAENPADNAKVIGSLADLHAVYNAVREGERRLREANQGVATTAEDIETNANGIEALTPELTSAGDARDRANTASNQFRAILSHLNLLNAVASQQDTLTADLISLRSQRRQMPVKQLEVSGVHVVRLTRYRAALADTGAALERLRSERRPINTSGLEQLGKIVADLTEFAGRVIGFDLALKMHRKTVSDLKSKAADIRTKLSAVKICPLCDQQMTEGF